MNLSLRVKSRAFCCGVTIRNGRVDRDGTAPYLRRYDGVNYEAFKNIARQKGWDIEEKRDEAER